MKEAELRLSILEEILRVVSTCPKCASCKGLAVGYFDNYYEILKDEENQRDSTTPPT